MQSKGVNVGISKAGKTHHRRWSPANPFRSTKVEALE